MRNYKIFKARYNKNKKDNSLQTIIIQKYKKKQYFSLSILAKIE